MKKYFLAGILLLCMAGTAYLAACSSSNSSSPTNTQTNTGDAAHGKYLVDTVTGCADCHSPLDAMGNIVDSMRFAGGQRFGLTISGANFAVYSRNITQDSIDGLGTWTDAEIIKAVRTGIIPAHALNGTSRTDTTLFALMPYSLLANYSDNDIQDIVAYLRTIKPIRYSPPSDTIPEFARAQAPKETIPDPAVANSTTARGQYLAAVALCADCHTPQLAPPQSGPNMAKFLAGGFPFDLPFGTVYSANITPDTATGIGAWSDAQIITATQQGMDKDGTPICPPMPWQRFAGLEPSDMQAIVAYLHNIPAVSNQVPANPHCP